MLHAGINYLEDVKMSRPPRFSYAHAVHHVTLRCNNKEFLFTVPSFALFLDVLQKAREKFPLALYNYCLMTNHLHLLVKVGNDDTLSKSMHWISSRFSQRFNRQEERRGHLWEGRFRSTIIEEDSYFFRCMTYIDLNPVRAKLAVTPDEYRWCGHRALRNENAAVLDFHDLYLDSGNTKEERYTSYIKMLEEDAARPAISLATQYFVGSSQFVSRMQKQFKMRENVKKEAENNLRFVGPRWGGTRCRNNARPHNP